MHVELVSLCFNMCGFAGFVHPSGVSSAEAAHILKKQTDAIFRRGPDDSGQWIDEALGIGFGHRRLSIVDLSPQGHQPMLSTCGRFVLIFNGEIYNHLDLRKKLSQSFNSVHWRGSSDTETLLVALSLLNMVEVMILSHPHSHPLLVGMEEVKILHLLQY